MKISLNWLRKYISLPDDVESISEILTAIGLEVEGIEKVESIKGGLKGVVVGEVKECDKHPNADKLSLTKVDIGGEEDLQIVCGAPNVAKGQKVLVATVGTTLYSPEGEAWKIKKGKIRGEFSEGMICAEDELGLGSDHDGIMVLDPSVEVGTLARKHFNIQDDHVFDIGLTPNRSDATCHFGVAQDLAAYLKVNSEKPIVVKDFIGESFEVDQHEHSIDVKLENKEACPRYSGVLLTGLTIKDSPSWIRDFLVSIGVRPINNVVDITNFILHAYGQPLHAFDYDKIEGHEIRVKCLPANTKFLSLDEKERSLDAEDLMICDGTDKPMCIGGVFGGLDSGVGDDTKTIFLESAHFDAGYVRRSSTRHLLRTDAAKVFEKGSDPNLTVKALKKAVLLLKEYADAKVDSELVDIYPEPIEPKEILLSFSNVNRLIGAELSREEVVAILHALGMQTKIVDESKIYVYVPTNKADVIREVDLIEEVLRIYGFNKVEIPTVLKTSINTREYPNARGIKESLSSMLASNGFNEMMGLSLAESKWYDDHSDFVFINNTSNIHLDIMRPDALLSGLDSVARNLNRQQNDLKLFEFGKSYLKKDEFEEEAFLSLFICGKEAKESWKNTKPADTDFYSLKKWVLLILDRLNIGTYQTEELEANTMFDYGIKFFRADQELVSFGKLNSAALAKFSVKQDVFYAKFNFDNLVNAAKKAKIKVKKLNKFPSTSRDLALVVDDSVGFSDILKLSNKTEKKLITDIQLFDVYKNDKQLGAGKKSYAVKFVIENYEKTLKDKEVDAVMNKLTKVFGKELGAVIRK